MTQHPTIRIQTTDSMYFAVTAPCGQSWPGMTHSDDLPIRTRKALAHADECSDCAETTAAAAPARGLPTPDEMLNAAQAALGNAQRALGDAADWLRSDWRPVGSSLTDDQARRRDKLGKAITAAKTAINKIR